MVGRVRKRIDSVGEEDEEVVGVGFQPKRNGRAAGEGLRRAVAAACFRWRSAVFLGLPLERTRENIMW